MTNSFDEKDFIRTVNAEIEDGKSKQEIYDKAVADGLPPKEVADVLVNIPSVARWQKYKIWHHLYLTALILLGVVNLLAPSIALAVQAALIFIVATRRFKYYYFCVVVGGWGLATLIATLLAYNTMSFTNLLAVVIPSAVFILPGILLPKFIVPKYTVENEVYINEEGNQRLTHKYIFTE